MCFFPFLPLLTLYSPLLPFATPFAPLCPFCLLGPLPPFTCLVPCPPFASPWPSLYPPLTLLALLLAWPFTPPLLPLYPPFLPFACLALALLQGFLAPATRISPGPLLTQPLPLTLRDTIHG